MRRRPAARRIVSVLSIVLLLGGAGMFAYPFATNLYSDLFLQRPLEREFETPDFREAYAAESAQNGESTDAADSAEGDGSAGDTGVTSGDPVTRIKIPAIGVETMVVEGTSLRALRAGAGHYPNTPLPGEDGNVAIAGHRTTYGRPFNQLDKVPPGSKIILETPLATHTYQVVHAPADASRPCPNGACWVTHPKDWSVVRQTDRPRLTLTTCHPKGSAAKRLILRADLVGSVPKERPAA